MSLHSLPESIRQRLASEYRFVANNMAEEPDPAKKMYWFSGFFGEATRMLNQSWDAELALIHQVTQDAYRQINGRVSESVSGQDTVIGLNEEIPPELTKVSDQLASLFESQTADGTRLLSILARIAELAFLSTGNGYYLYRKGHLRL